MHEILIWQSQAHKPTFLETPIEFDVDGHALDLLNFGLSSNLMTISSILAESERRRRSIARARASLFGHLEAEDTYCKTILKGGQWSCNLDR